MKNLKKLVSVIVTVAMLISSFAALTVNAASGNYGDVDETNSYYKAIKILSGLGVVQGDEVGNFNPTSDIKRSEMVTLVCRALGEEAVAQSSGGSSFDDVSADHWAAGYIAWGVAGNIVNGVGDNKFDPDAPVKFQDAVVMVLRALGYDRIANRAENGGYPTGYLKIASQQGVLYNTNFDGATAATREVVAQVIYNALTTPLVDVSYYAPDPADDEYVIYNGKNNTDLRTLLTWTNEIYKVKAEVNDTAKTKETLRKDAENPKVELYVTGTYDYAPVDILDGEVASADGDLYNPNNINDNGKEPLVVAYVGETDVADYFGYTVEAYITEDDLTGEWILLASVVDSKSTVSETVSMHFDSYNEIKDSSNNTKGWQFEYYIDLNDSKTQKIDVVADPDIYYNGVALTNVQATGAVDVEDLLINYANSITFMGPKNSDYTKIFVTDYAYEKVDSVKVDEMFIKYDGGGITLDVDERNDDTFVYNLYDGDGNVITLADIQEDDILNIVAPLDASGRRGNYNEVPFMDIYVTRNVVTGSVDEEVIADETYRINGEEYDLAPGADISVGDEGVFYITIDGYVFDSDASSVVNKNYSFIVNYGAEYSFGVSTHQLKLYTVDGVLETYDVAPTLRVYQEEQVDNAWKWVATSYKRNDGTQDAFFAANVVPYVEGAKATYTEGADADATADNKAAVVGDTKADAIAGLGNRLVTFKLNNSNEISEIRYAGTHIDDFKVVQNNGIRYYDDTQVFGGYDLNETSKLFVAPVTEISDVPEVVGGVETGNRIVTFNVDEEDIELAAFSTLDEDKNGGYNDVFLYSFDSDKGYLGAAISGTEITAAMKKSHLAVVKTKSTGLDAEGFSVDKYTFVQSGETITKTVDNDATSTEVPAMETGDVFRYVVNAEDEINKTEFIFDRSTGTFTTVWPYADLNANDVAIVYGEVTEIKGGKMTVDSVGTKLTLNDTEGNTYALVDESRIGGTNESSAVKVLSGSGYLNESYNNYEYTVVALIGETGRYEDVVQFEKVIS